MNILIVDDERNILRTTSLALQSMGHKTEVAQSGSQALSRLREHRIEGAFLDLLLGDENGIDVLQQMLSEQADLPVIVFTAHGTVESAVRAMRLGAYDYIPKPFVPEQVRQILKKLERDRKVRNRVNLLETELARIHPAIQLESNEPCMQAAFDVAFRAAGSEAGILLLGASGTGKTVLARAIHERSRRSEQPFVTVNCPSLSKELLESELFGHVKGAFTGAVQETWGKVSVADGGTLFLDEIGEMPVELQPKLLRLLQDREYERVGETRLRKADIRVIAATNRDVREAVEQGVLREDLLYRLNVITVEMPALADRPDDILPLAENYLSFFGERMGKPEMTFSEEVKRAFLKYGWPGNLREMRNVIERATILCREHEITLKDLPSSLEDRQESAIRPGSSVTLAELEEEHIRRVLRRDLKLEEAAELLGIDTATLYRKRRRLGLLD
jgi:two-component system, NtrC family, response regulator AlgB